jgi:hypothetical protein
MYACRLETINEVAENEEAFNDNSIKKEKKNFNNSENVVSWPNVRRQSLRRLSKFSDDDVLAGLTTDEYEKLMFRNRDSIVSKQSVELFIQNFPESDDDYVERDVLQTVYDLFKFNFGIKRSMSNREKLRLILNSSSFYLVLIVLVIFDIICVLTLILIDMIKNNFHDHNIHKIEHIVEIISLFILLIFLLSFLFRLILIPKTIFKRKLEIFDAILVITSFILEILLLAKKDSIYSFEIALITFRYIYFFSLKNLNFISRNLCLDFFE